MSKANFEFDLQTGEIDINLPDDPNPSEIFLVLGMLGQVKDHLHNRMEMGSEYEDPENE